MRRRPDDSVDPLDLLLDTVCNLFAVMIFIAIFAAILVGPPTEIPEGQRQITVAETVEPTDAMEPPAETIVEIPDPDLAEIDHLLQNAGDELARRLAMIAKLERNIESMQAAEDNGAGILTETQAEITTLKEDIEATRTITQVPMRTPRKGERPDAIPVSIFLSGESVFIPTDFRGWNLEPTPKNEWWKYMSATRFLDRFLIRTRSTATRRKDGSFRRSLMFRDGQGISATDIRTLRSDQDWREQIDSLIPEKHLVYVSVRPDSFAAFGIVRSELARLGFNYDVYIELQTGPVTIEEWIIGVPTSQ